ncbi:MAG TPA: hypothetical protein VE974_02615 [Thermoanaerobaculia bacterium]|nr:hypothetical protein [Thermoanaerobaculia bacterium]
MSGATSALYEPLIERDLEAIPAAARTFVSAKSPARAMDELWIAVARFAVLAYAPSQHSKRAVMAVRAAYEMRTFDIIVECARYAAESRQPWSEPPILEPPEPDASSSLEEVIASGDRLRGDRWLSAHLGHAEHEFRDVARGDALLMLDTALALEQTLGSKGRYALLRMVMAELMTPSDHPEEPLDVLVQRAIASNGAVDDVRAVFIAASLPPRPQKTSGGSSLVAYRLARDYAQTLIAHSVARTLPARADEFLRAVHHNLEHGESFAEWSFA